jgi:hypothetical protein
MATFQVGDRVRTIQDEPGFPKGAVATVAEVVRDYGLRLQFDGAPAPDRAVWVPSILQPHVDTFPISADKDPWRESEPGLPAANGEGWCGEEVPRALVPGCYIRPACSRAAHSGHHVARDTECNVIARWPQTAPAEKRGPQVGDEVVRTEVNYPMCYPKIPFGARGLIETVLGGDIYARFSRQCSTSIYVRHADWGVYFVTAAEWDERQRITNGDVTPVPLTISKLKVGGSCIHHHDASGCAVCNPGKSGQVIIDGKWVDPPDRRAGMYEIREGADAIVALVSIERMARALFELDMDERAAAIGDDGKGGIGKAAVLDRMWRTASAEVKAYCEWRAAIVLKRAGALS